MKTTLDRYNHPVFARQYDSGEQESRNGDISFYTRLCKPGHKKVLEVACGAGRVTIPLKKAGIAISGIDFAAEMIKLARQKARKEKLTIDFRVADAANFRAKEPYDAIIIPYYSLGLFPEKKFSLIIENLARNLKKNGLLAFDVSVPKKGAKKPPAVVTTDWSEPMLLADMGISLRRKIIRKAIPHTRHMISTYIWEITDKKGKKTREKNAMTFLTYPLSWYVRQFAKHGFTVQRKKIIRKPGAATDHAFVVLRLQQ